MYVFALQVDRYELQSSQLQGSSVGGSSGGLLQQFSRHLLAQFLHINHISKSLSTIV